MNQLFFDSHIQAFWANSNHPSIHIFELNPHIKGCFPKVFVAISQQGMSICLSYFVQKTDWLIFETLTQQKIARQDYLWEQNCLECFFEFNHQKAYLEMNSSPNGRYNFYTFEGYRTPNTMPPKKDNQLTLCYIPTKHTHPDWHIRHIDIILDEYFLALTHHGQACYLSKYHPTAILYHNQNAIYYAVTHANPPDFHHKDYWISNKIIQSK